VEGLASGGVDYVTKRSFSTSFWRVFGAPGQCRLAHETNAALDASGRFLFATNTRAAFSGATPKARQMLSGDGAATVRNGCPPPWSSSCCGCAAARPDPRPTAG